MTIADKQLWVCSCNGTMPLDGEAIARTLGIAPQDGVKRMLCQKELGTFAGAAKGDLGQRMSLEVDAKPLSGEFLKTAKTINNDPTDAYICPGGRPDPVNHKYLCNAPASYAQSWVAKLVGLHWPRA